MCGIAGIVRWNSSPAEGRRGEVERMTKSIAHRGPDGLGFYVRDGVALGHARLAIIDPEGGYQPMSNRDESVWIIYNGEMYNFWELRAELESKGHNFQTRCDTEVAIAAYEEWGAECVKKFRGMFAFALADFKNRRMLVARDHFGIKPFYYRRGRDYFAFASELPALREVEDATPAGNLEAVEQYLRFQYVPQPQTVYREVFKLPPASHAVIDFDGRLEGPTRYWDLRFEPETGLADEEWEERAAAVIKDSVRAHLVSDVPFGVFLSGGVDSSLVASEMSRLLEHPVRAFSVGFREREHSELPYAEEVAKRCGIELHTEVVREDMLSILPDLVAHYGEPFGDSSAVPTWYVARLARRHVPMVLSGDGGDEGFAGYDNYARWMEASPLRRARASAREAAPRAALYWLRQAAGQYAARGTLNHLGEWQQKNLYFGDEARLALWRAEFRGLVGRGCEAFEEADRRARGLGRLSYAQYLDYQTYLPGDILTKVDVASMYHGLEVRTPLVDLRVVELAARLPARMRFRRNGSNEVTRKYVLKRLLARRFPEEFVRRKKRGFGIPRSEWFAEGQTGRKLWDEVVLDPESRLYEWFRPEAVREQMTAHERGPSDNSGALWLLVVLGIWLAQNPRVSFD